MAKKQTPLMKYNPNAAKGVVSVDLAKLSSIPLAVYLQQAGRFLNAVPARFYDTALYTAGVITTAHSARLFTHGIGDNGKIANTGAVIAEKKETLTNMSGDGEFEGGVTFIMEGLEIEIFQGSTNETTFSNGEITDPTVSALANFSAVNHQYAISTQFKATFFRGEKQQMFSGLLQEFPPSLLMSGAFGNVADGFVQNYGKNEWNKLNTARVLESQDKFSVSIEPLAGSFTTQVPFNIRATLVGKVITPYFP